MATIGHELGKMGHEPTPDLPEGFQMTELGPLPKEWRVVRLGEVADIRQGRTPKRDLYNDKRGYRIIKVKDFQDGEKIAVTPSGDRSFVSVDLGAPFRVRSEDILILNSGHSTGVVGQKVGIVPRELEGAFYVAELTAIRAQSESSNSFYIFSCLMHPRHRERIRALVKGGHLYAEQLRSIPLPLPPLPEQRAIAHVLRTVQRAKEATDGVIAALKELKKSLMQHLFTYGPVPVGAKIFSPQQETEIGPIPAHWWVVRLGEVCKFQGGTQPPKKEFVYRPQPGYVRLLQIRDFESDKNAVFVKFRKGLRLVEKDDVLIARYGASVGKILRGKAGAINVAIVKTIPDKEKIAKNFLYYRLDFSDFQSFVKGLGGRAAQAGFNKGELNTFLLPLPPLSEQREIARILQAVDAKIAAEQARRAALEELFKTLLDQLMTGKIRINDPVGAQRRRAPTTFPNPED